MFTRNWLFISDETQKAISDIKILNAGVGLGSMICELAVRTGFKNFIIADGDNVNISNLNRQAYDSSQISENKAKATELNLKAINPEIEIQTIQKYLDKKDLKKLIPKCDLIVNTIDFDNKNFSICSQFCRDFKKTEFFPINLGFGGALICFDQNAESFSSYFKAKNHKELKKAILDFIILENNESPNYLKEAYSNYLKNPKPYDPQLGISSFITAGLVVSTMVRYASGEKIKIFPSFYHIDTSLTGNQGKKSLNESLNSVFLFFKKLRSAVESKTPPPLEG